MRYTWTSFAILGIWVAATLLISSQRLPNPEVFFFFVMIITVVLSYIGFRSL